MKLEFSNILFVFFFVCDKSTEIRIFRTFGTEFLFCKSMTWYLSTFTIKILPFRNKNLEIFSFWNRWPSWNFRNFKIFSFFFQINNDQKCRMRFDVTTRLIVCFLIINKKGRKTKNRYKGTLLLCTCQTSSDWIKQKHYFKERKIMD